MGDVINAPKESSSNSHDELDKRNRLSKYVVGTKDKTDYTITEIYAREEEFIIFGSEGTSGFHHFKITLDTIDECDDMLTNNFQRTKDKFKELILYLDKVDADASYKRRASSAILTAIKGNIAEAEFLFEKIESDARKEYRGPGLFYYLLGPFIITFTLFILALSVYLFQPRVISSIDPELPTIIYAIAFACFGGLASIVEHIYSISTKYNFGNWIYAVCGASRLIFSILAGVVAYILFSYTLSFFMPQAENIPIFLLLVLSYFLGSKENLIPSPLRRSMKKI
ncbi:hypothetical protein ACG1BZ_00785 [Microbulbifer sp. CNSA002]|uniref:hypothetical protein n=1 Tax=Microbulbifer sp. CNSA002 TaxID=3373604 RepID=UPI0039B50AF7